MTSTNHYWYKKRKETCEYRRKKTMCKFIQYQKCSVMNCPYVCLIENLETEVLKKNRQMKLIN